MTALHSFLLDVELDVKPKCMTSASCSGKKISCGCDQKGRRLSWETGIEKMGFEVFPERCDRGAYN